MQPRVRAVLAFGAVLGVLFPVSVASAQARDAPTCGIVASASGTEALETGDQLMLRELRAFDRTHVHDTALLEAALSAYDDACLGGELSALERRATVLARLDLPLDAIRSLDAFLARRPLATLDTRLRERVAANLARLEARVASLDLTLSPEDASVTLDGRAEIGRVRASAGTHLLRVSAPGFVTREETIELALGAQARTVTLEAVVAIVGVSEVSSMEAPAVEETPEVSTRGAEGAGPEEPRVIVRDLEERDDLRAPMIASFVVGALALVGGVVAGVWTASVWDEHASCLELGGLCGDLADEGYLGLGIAIGAGTLGLVGLGVGIGLAVESGSRGAGGYRSARCGVGLLSVGCTAAF